MVRLPVDWEPEVPVHPAGETVQEEALVELHLTVVFELCEMLELSAVMVAVGEGTGATPTPTVTLFEAVPPVPVQDRV